MGHGAWGMGHGAWGMGHGAWGMGHGAWGMGHGAWGIPHFFENRYTNNPSTTRFLKGTANNQSPITNN
ncbi:MAG: hypothetical protein QQW96_25405 [Tychonema bourrellyi B0820]|nr:hypothetical protein [Tychonema bourrellyi B0820]